tara:strand:+ start:106 stop:1251 length:1146 start_codon:yes stop_codon:yes gene_type:complete
MNLNYKRIFLEECSLPLIKNNYILDGSIYNKFSINELYQKHGKKFIEYLDGEFSIVYFDKDNHIVYIATDIFGTKPIYIGLERTNFCISSFKSNLLDKGFKFIYRLENSSIFELNLKNYEYKISKHSKFNIEEKYNNFDRCLDAFKKSVDKRSSGVIGANLSGGHDTGAILQRLIENKNKCKFYYFVTGREDNNIIKLRKKILKNNNLIYKELNYKYNPIIHKKLFKLKDKIISSDLFYHFDIDICSILDTIYSNASNDGVENFLTGLGGDEMLKNNQTYPDIDKDLSVDIDKRIDFLIGEYPGDNTNPNVEGRFWIDAEEYMSNLYGINLRYPFFDKEFLQNFLNLTYEMKNYCYKSVIQYYLDINNMPYMKYKAGLGSN